MKVNHIQTTINMNCNVFTDSVCITQAPEVGTRFHLVFGVSFLLQIGECFTEKFGDKDEYIAKLESGEAECSIFFSFFFSFPFLKFPCSGLFWRFGNH